MTTTTNSSRTFGIELEIVGITQEAAAAAINATGLVARVESYNHARRTWWKVTTDSSVKEVRNGVTVSGCEVVSPVLAGSEGLAQVEKVCKALEAAGARVNKTCGMHVHVGAGDLTVKQIATAVKLWVKHEDRVNQLISPSRRGYDATGYQPSYFCRDNLYTLTGGVHQADWTQVFARIDRCRTIDQLCDLFGGQYGGETRYHKLNLVSYFRHSTIEVRCHQGTVNAEKACQWIKFCLGLVDQAAARSKVNHKRTSKLSNLFSAVNLEASGRRFYAKRARELAREAAAAAA